MATFKISELYDANEGLASLVKDRIPSKVALKLRKLARVVGQRVEDGEAERAKLLDVYGKKDENGKLVQGPRGAQGEVTIRLADPDAFNRDLAELMSQETEIADDLLIDPGEIETIEMISVETLLALGGLLK